MAAANASGTAFVMAADGIVLKKIVPGPNKKITLVRNGLLGILQTDGSLYLYDTDRHALQKLAATARDFSVTDDGSLIAALEQKSIEVFSLNDPSGYYRFNAPNIANAVRLIWYKDRSHLFVAYKNSVAFLDLADTGLNNFTTVANALATVTVFPAYDPQTNSLYVTNLNRSVVRFDFPN